MLIVILGIIINILAIIALLTGLFYNFQKPKNKAIFGYSVAACMLSYIVILSFIFIYKIITAFNLYSIVLLMCIISPFIIGKLVKYETLKRYTVIQIICFILSLLALFMTL